MPCYDGQGLGMRRSSMQCTLKQRCMPDPVAAASSSYNRALDVQHLEQPTRLRAPLSPPSCQPLPCTGAHRGGEVWPRCQHVVPLVGQLDEVVQDAAVQHAHASHLVQRHGLGSKLAQRGHIVLGLGRCGAYTRGPNMEAHRDRTLLSTMRGTHIELWLHPPADTATSTTLPDALADTLILDDWLAVGASCTL